MAMFILTLDFGNPRTSIFHQPWRLYIIVGNMFTIISLVAFIFLPESAKFLLATNRNAEALDVLHLIHRINKVNGVGNNNSHFSTHNIGSLKLETKCYVLKRENYNSLTVQNIKCFNVQVY